MLFKKERRKKGKGKKRGRGEQHKVKEMRICSFNTYYLKALYKLLNFCGLSFFICKMGTISICNIAKYCE